MKFNTVWHTMCMNWTNNVKQKMPPHNITHSLVHLLTNNTWYPWGGTDKKKPENILEYSCSVPWSEFQLLGHMWSQLVKTY